MILNAEMTKDEEEQIVSGFFQIIKSLCDNATSFLYQNGIISGDTRHEDLKKRVKQQQFVEKVVNCLTRPKESWNSDVDFDSILAVLLVQWCKEANQIFTEIYNVKKNKLGVASGVLALSYHLALIERAGAKLNFPSINDSVYWGVEPLYPIVSFSAEPKSKPKPKHESKQSAPPIIKPLQQNSEQSRAQSTTPAKSNTPARSKPAIVQKAEVEAKKARLENSKTNKAEIKEEKPKVAEKMPVDKVVKKVAAENNTGKSNPKVSEPPKAATLVSNKPEGPVKATARRILSQIAGSSFEDVLEAMRNEDMMEDLYYAEQDPIPIQILGIDDKKRKVKYKKKKSSQEEFVSFLNLRKIVSEL